MPKPTGYGLNIYIKALEICIAERGYGYLKYHPSKGSAFTFEIFENKDDPTPAIVWSVHIGHSKKQEIYSDDLKKAWERTAIPRDRFMEVLEDL